MSITFTYTFTGTESPGTQYGNWPFASTTGACELTINTSWSSTIVGTEWYYAGLTVLGAEHNTYSTSGFPDGAPSTLTLLMAVDASGAGGKVYDTFAISFNPISPMPAAGQVFTIVIDGSCLPTGGPVATPMALVYKMTTSYVAAGTDTQYIPYAIADAKGDLIAGTGADTATRLPVGTNGYVLTADSSTSTGLKWDVGGGGGGMSNPMTTQDDIIVGGSSGTPGRLAKGSDSQVLTISPSTHHVAWATPSAGGGAFGYSLLSSSATSMGISSIPSTYNVIVITVATRTDQGSQTVCNIRINGDTTASHYLSGGGGSSSQRIFVSAYSGNPGPYWTVNSLYLPNYAAATASHWVHDSNAPRGDGGTSDFNGVIWTPSAAAAITDVLILANVGNFVAGSWIMAQGF